MPNGRLPNTAASPNCAGADLPTTSLPATPDTNDNAPITRSYLDSETCDLKINHLSMQVALQGGLAPGQHFAEYEIVGRIGHGGMGVVYRARQLRLQREVALKMILSGEHAREEDQLRFLSEAKAIARLQHPNIVQVFDLARHNGRLYFSMEYVAGGTLSRELGGTPQPAEQSAKLVAKLAAAIQAAHDHDIVHRDLKPANILLTEEGEPKITDFGLAKLGDSGLTASQAIMGTPSYMAPEQARGETHGVGPAADVYALGAILYECLTGRPPFKSSTAIETIRQVLDQEPAPIRSLVGRTSRDLEIICLKCLRKDPTKRYPSAAALAEDLHRFIDGRPILAKPVGSLERARLWMRRNPAVSALLGLIVVISGCGLAAFAAQYRSVVFERDRARIQENLQKSAAKEANTQTERAVKAQKLAAQNAETAKVRAEQSERTADFLEGLFQANDPTSFLHYGFRPAERKGAEVTARELLDRGALAIGKELNDQPLVKARMLNLIGRVNRSIGRYDEARSYLEQALVLREQSPGVPELDLAESLYDLGWISHDIGDYTRSEEMLSRSIAIRRRFPEEELDLAQALIMLGWTLTDQRHPEAEPLIQEALKIRLARLPKDHRDISIARVVLAAYYFNTGEYTKAAPIVLLVRSGFSNDQSGAQIEKGMAAFQTGMALYSIGLYSQAEASMHDSIRIARPFLGTNHPLLCIAHAQIGATRELAGNVDGAMQSYGDCLDVARNSIGMGHPRILEVMSAIEDVLEPRGRLAEIEPYYQEILAAVDKQYGPQHVNCIMPRILYADALLRLKRDPESLELVRQALELYPKDRVLRSTDYESFLSSLARKLSDRAHFVEAAELFRCAARQCEAQAPNTLDHWWDLAGEANTLRRAGRLTEVQPVLDRAFAVTRDGKLRAATLASTLYSQGLLEQAQGAAPENIEVHWQAALAAWRDDPTGYVGDQDQLVNELVELLLARSDYLAIEQVLIQHCDLLEKRGAKLAAKQCLRLRQIASCQAARGNAALSPDIHHRCRELLGKVNTAEARWNLISAACLLPNGAAEELLTLLPEQEPQLRGIILARGGKSDEAASLFIKVDRVPDWLHAAQAFHGAGRTDEARGVIDKVNAWLKAPSKADATKSNRALQSWAMQLEIDALLQQLKLLTKPQKN